MSGVSTLIKLHTKELEEMQKKVAYYRDQQQQLYSYKKKLHSEVMQEQDFVAKNPQLISLTSHNYSKKVKDQLKTIERSLNDVESLIVQLQDKIAQQYSEVKKYDIVLNQSKTEQIQKENAAQQKELDTVATNNYLKQLKNNS